MSARVGVLGPDSAYLTEDAKVRYKLVVKGPKADGQAQESKYGHKHERALDQGNFTEQDDASADHDFFKHQQHLPVRCCPESPPPPGDPCADGWPSRCSRSLQMLCDRCQLSWTRTKCALHRLRCIAAQRSVDCLLLDSTYVPTSHQTHSRL